MKLKTMAATAVTCIAAIFGTSVPVVSAEPMTYDLQATEITSEVETQDLSAAVRNRNRIIGAIIGAAAIGAIVNHNKKHRDNYDDDYDRNGGGDYHDRSNRRESGRRNAPPPPPMPSQHR